MQENHIDATGEGKEQGVIRVPFDRRLLLSFVEDIDWLSFLYRSDAVAAEARPAPCFRASLS